MHTHSVSCWRVSDKTAAIFAWVGSHVRWSTRRPSTRTISTLHNSSACLITTFYLCTDSVLEESGAINVKRPLPFPLVPPIQSSKGVCTCAHSRKGAFGLGRRGVRFEENYPYFEENVQTTINLKPEQYQVVVMHESRREKGRSVSREGAFGLGRSDVRFGEKRCLLIHFISVCYTSMTLLTLMTLTPHPR
jgi:hypothetical protein